MKRLYLSLVVMSISTIWLVVDATLILFYGSRFYTASVFVDTVPLRLAFAILTIATIAYIAQYTYEQQRLKQALKVSVNHYVKNKVQELVLALDLYQMDQSAESLLILEKARDTLTELLDVLDKVTKENKTYLMNPDLTKASKSQNVGS